jgi:hypothetical protein
VQPAEGRMPRQVQVGQQQQVLEVPADNDSGYIIESGTGAVVMCLHGMGGRRRVEVN